MSGSLKGVISSISGTMNCVSQGDFTENISSTGMVGELALIKDAINESIDMLSDTIFQVITIIAKRTISSELNYFPAILPGDYLKLSISDTGVGMDPDVIERVFDPFFTTKEIGKGSGLGLSIVHSIVKDHNGHIFVESKLGEGTTFQMLFPLADDTPNQIS